MGRSVRPWSRQASAARRPERGRLAEIAGAAVEPLAGPPVAGGVQEESSPMGAGGLGMEGGDALGMEGADGVADGLDGAAEGPGDVGGAPALGTGGEDLAASEGERLG